MAPAASGKGTLASRLAARFHLPHLDTGLLYRRVGFAWLPFADGADAEARAIALAHRVADLAADPARLISPEVADAASRVAAMPGVRAALLAEQRRFAHQPGGAVLDGRDIGTVIAPKAEVKLFVTADPHVRADRRASQLEARGEQVDRAALLADIRARDARDMGRADAPLRPAPDAHLLDTTDLDIEAAFRAAVAIVDTAMARKSGTP